MEPVLEIKQGRLGYLVGALLSSLLGFIFFDLGLNHAAVLSRYVEDIKSLDGQSGMEFLPYMVLVMTIPLTIISIYNAIKNPVVFTVYNDGLQANTNGISTGLVYWHQIISIEETTMTSRSGSGLRVDVVLAIYLKDRTSFTGKIAGLERVLKKVVDQTGSLNPNEAVMSKQPDGFPILIPKAVFGKQYDEAVDLIQQLSKQQVVNPSPGV
ncbi:MAG: hypothetical protein ACKO5C_07925 [Ferruginibacter sp.]